MKVIESIENIEEKVGMDILYEKGGTYEVYTYFKDHPSIYAYLFVDTKRHYYYIEKSTVKDSEQSRVEYLLKNLKLSFITKIAKCADRESLECRSKSFTYDSLHGPTLSGVDRKVMEHFIKWHPECSMTYTQKDIIDGNLEEKVEPRIENISMKFKIENDDNVYYIDLYSYNSVDNEYYSYGTMILDTKRDKYYLVPNENNDTNFGPFISTMEKLFIHDLVSKENQSKLCGRASTGVLMKNSKDNMLELLKNYGINNIDEEAIKKYHYIPKKYDTYSSKK